MTRDERRFGTAAMGSVVVNALFLLGGATMAFRPPHTHESPIVIERIVLEAPKPKVKPVISKPKPEPVKPKLPEPKPVPRPVEPEPVRPVPTRPRLTPPPQGARNRILTAKPFPTAPPSRADFTVSPGGNAKPGVPLRAQEPGNAVVSPPKPVPTPEPVAPPPPPVPPAPAPPPALPTPPAPPPIAPPAPPPPVKPKGTTRDAEPVSTVNPDIPDSLKREEFKSFVRVRVEIAENGSFEVVLRTSSGNKEVDDRVLSALKKWKWKPALKDSETIPSVKLFKFEFEVN